MKKNILFTITFCLLLGLVTPSLADSSMVAKNFVEDESIVNREESQKVEGSNIIINENKYTASASEQQVFLNTSTAVWISIKPSSLLVGGHERSASKALSKNYADKKLSIDGLYDDMVVDYSFTNTMVKETIVVNKKLSGGDYIFKYVIELPKGSTIKKLPGGYYYVFIDGEHSFSLTPIFAANNKGTTIFLESSLVGEDDLYELSITLTEEQINTLGSEFYIDPTVEVVESHDIRSSSLFPANGNHVLKALNENLYIPVIILNETTLNSSLVIKESTDYGETWTTKYDYVLGEYGLYQPRYVDYWLLPNGTIYLQLYTDWIGDECIAGEPVPEGMRTLKTNDYFETLTELASANPAGTDCTSSAQVEILPNNKTIMVIRRYESTYLISFDIWEYNYGTEAWVFKDRTDFMDLMGVCDVDTLISGFDFDYDDNNNLHLALSTYFLGGNLNSSLMYINYSASDLTAYDGAACIQLSDIFGGQTPVVDVYNGTVYVLSTAVVSSLASDFYNPHLYSSVIGSGVWTDKALSGLAPNPDFTEEYTFCHYSYIPGETEMNNQASMIIDNDEINIFYSFPPYNTYYESVICHLSTEMSVNWTTERLDDEIILGETWPYIDYSLASFGNTEYPSYNGYDEVLRYVVFDNSNDLIYYDQLNRANLTPGIDDESYGETTYYTDDNITLSARYLSENRVNGTMYANWTINGAFNTQQTSSIDYSGDYGTFALQGSTFAKNDVVAASLWVVDNNSLTSAVTTINNLTIANSAPVITALSITPTTPAVEDDILCTNYTYTDADNDSIIVNNIWWYRGGTLLSAFQNTTTIGAANTAMGENYHCVLSISDGTNLSANATSATVYITDQATPTISSMTVTPSAVYSDSSFVIRATCADASSTITYVKATITKPDLTSSNTTLTTSGINTYSATYTDVTDLGNYTIGPFYCMDSSGNLQNDNTTLTVVSTIRPPPTAGGGAGGFTGQSYALSLPLTNTDVEGYCGDSVCGESENPNNCWEDCKINYDTLITCLWDDSIDCNYRQNWFALVLIGIIIMAAALSVYRYENKPKSFKYKHNY